MGTMAHSWIMSFPSELEAFRAYAKIYPQNSVFLIDTYDTLKSGIKNAIIVGKELVEKGYNPTSQLVGYILSEDPTYITTHNNARSLIRRLDRDELLQDLVKEYLKNSNR